MSDDTEAVPEPAPDEAPGWKVLDADGNIVQSGSVVELVAVSDPGEEEQQ